MAKSITTQMYNDLDRFLANKTIMDVDRNTFLVCNLTDSRYKLTISLVFMRDWDSIESDGYNYVSIYGKGVVFTIPCYWVSIPKELAMEYICYIIDTFYREEVTNWNLGYTPDDSDSDTSTDINCGCGCNPPQIPPTYPPCGIV